MTDHKGLPVSGYKTQSQAHVDAVNEFKRLEEQALRAVERLRESTVIAEDGRWLAIGVTDLEKGFMAINRSIFRPGRVALPGDHNEPFTLIPGDAE